VRDITKPERFRRCVQAEEFDGKYWQKRVEWDREDGSFTEVADEMMTSGNPNSEVVRGKGSVVTLRRDDVRWLYEQLGALLQHWAEHE
jgi:hypothetical protein